MQDLGRSNMIIETKVVDRPLVEGKGIEIIDTPTGQEIHVFPEELPQPVEHVCDKAERVRELEKIAGVQDQSISDLQLQFRVLNNNVKALREDVDRNEAGAMDRSAVLLEQHKAAGSVYMGLVRDLHKLEEDMRNFASKPVVYNTTFVPYTARWVKVVLVVLAVAELVRWFI